MPTIARVVPEILDARMVSRLRTLLKTKQSSLHQTEHPNPCPHRSAVPVTREGHGKLFHSVPSGSPSVMDATVPAMSPISVVGGDCEESVLHKEHFLGKPSGAFAPLGP